MQDTLQEKMEAIISELEFISETMQLTLDSQKNTKHMTYGYRLIMGRVIDGLVQIKTLSH